MDSSSVSSLCPDIRGALLKKSVAALIAVGSWIEVEGGYNVHGYLEHNASALMIEHERAAARSRYYRRKGEPDVNGSHTSPEVAPSQRPEFARTPPTSVSQSVVKEETAGVVSGSTSRGDAAPPSAAEAASAPRPPAASPTRQLTREEQLALTRAGLSPEAALAEAARLREQAP